MLAKETRKKLPEEIITLHVALQNCKTICKYLDILDKNNWIDFELNGYPPCRIKNLIPEYRRVNQFFYNKYDQPIRMTNDFANTVAKQFVYNPIMEMLRYANTGLILATSKTIDCLNSHEYKNKHGITGIPHVKYSEIPVSSILKIINGVQNKIYEFLDNVILELRYGSIPENIFAQIRYDVDSELMKHCPAAIEKITLLYEQLGTDSPIVYSQIASTCRQAIKDVADVLFPAQKEPYIDSDGKERSVKDNNTVNRILARIDSDSEQKVLKSMFDYIANFLEAMQQYASRGDHSSFTKSDATRCIVYTYFLLGDILHYYTKHQDEKSINR